MIIELENIKNARDLGGMKAAEGKRIKPKRLIRSSRLFEANENDVNILTKNYNLKNVVDFRSTDERDESPHPNEKFPGINYYFLKSFDTTEEIVTRDEKSNYLLMQNADKLTVEMAIKIINMFYYKIPTMDKLQKAYKRFFEILLDTNDGATLWHCSLGKDRAGIAAVLTEYVLGVSKEDILNDYLLTNKYLEEKKNEDMSNAFRVFYGTQPSFLEYWYKSINENFGSIDKYLQDVLNIDDEKIEKLRKMYLE